MIVTELRRALEELERQNLGGLQVFVDVGGEYFVHVEKIGKAVGLEGEPCVLMNDNGGPYDSAMDWWDRANYPRPANS